VQIASQNMQGEGLLQKTAFIQISVQLNLSGAEYSAYVARTYYR